MFGFEFLQHFALLGDDGFQGFLEVFLGAGAGGGIAAGCGDCAEVEGDSELRIVSRRRRRGEERVGGVEYIRAVSAGTRHTLTVLRTRADLACSDIAETSSIQFGESRQTDGR